MDTIAEALMRVLLLVLLLLLLLLRDNKFDLPVLVTVDADCQAVATPASPNQAMYIVSGVIADKSFDADSSIVLLFFFSLRLLQAAMNGCTGSRTVVQQVLFQAVFAR